MNSRGARNAAYDACVYSSELRAALQVRLIERRKIAIREVTVRTMFI